MSLDVPRRHVEVLVVDDSALMRQLMTVVLSEDRGFTVRTAGDPFIAMRKIETCRPDAIVLDLEMPRMDGLTFLRRIMAEDPIPVVVCSSLVPDGSELSMQALMWGAVDVVLKPHTGPGESLDRWKESFVDHVSAAAQANVNRRAFTRHRPMPRGLIGRLPPVDRAVVIGASTGGTEAIAAVLAGMPANAPATVIVQHMPSPFTTAFARRLDSMCAMNVREAAEGDVLEQGTALIAPGSHHVSLVRQSDRTVTVALEDGPPVNRHRPSVDVLFDSAARVLGGAAIGVLLTGMGRDGAAGLLELRKCGAVTIAQDEASSVIFGMPRAAIEAGAAVHVLGLQHIGEAVLAAALRAKPYGSSSRHDD